MNALGNTNILAFRPAVRAVAARPRPAAAAKPVIRATWIVSRETGRLECTWAEGDTAVPAYSRAA